MPTGDTAHGGANDGTFCMCIFWFAECLAEAGDASRARFIFEKMPGPSGDHLGNFPQAFTPLGLLGAADAIDRSLRENPKQSLVIGWVTLFRNAPSRNAPWSSEGAANARRDGAFLEPPARRD